MWQTDAGMVGFLKYNADLFDKATIKRMIGHFTVLLEGIVAGSPLGAAQPICQLPLLTEAEYHQIVHEWNDTAVDFGEPQTIHALFEQQVERTPDAIALVFEAGEQVASSKSASDASDDLQPASLQTRLTYSELNARANQLAHHLIELGVQADTLVAVAMERSIEMMASLLAVLKAGAAYVPIDPTYPEERIRHMLNDSAAPILLTQSYLSLAKFTDDVDAQGNAVQPVHVLAVDTMIEQLYSAPFENDRSIADQSTSNPQTQTSPNDLAYVIYTSGSTGQPKGVMASHTNVVSMLNGFEKIAPAQRERIGTSVCPFGFDVSVWEFFSVLCFGGSLHLLTVDTYANPLTFAEYMTNHQVTSSYIPPALLLDIVDTYEQQNLAFPLERLLVGVEPITEGLLQRFRNLSEGLYIINGYGPTESTICATFFNFSQQTKSDQRTPIGKPVANYKIFLFNKHQQPIPVGVAGELCIGGIGVTRGYLNRPELTAERFISHPEFGRLYKTGDLCRWLPDGNIEYIGRTDFQVKIRGFRIELGEIEHALLAQEGVREAVVLAREENDDKRLVAYVVQAAGEQVASKQVRTGASSIDLQTCKPATCNLQPATLRQALAQQLPDYMIPSAFVFLKAMPLTPNGKLDRLALPAPDYTDTQSELVAPRTEIESQVAAIWQEVLGFDQASPEHRRRIGVYDNFFALGGHSLLATQVISRVHSQLNLDIPLKSLYEVSQLEDFAQLISQAQESTDKPIVRISREQPLPLSFAQQRLWFLNQLEPDSAFYNIPIQLWLTGQVDVAALETSFRYLIERHESLRTIFGPLYSSPLTKGENSSYLDQGRSEVVNHDGEANQFIHPPSWAAQFTMPITPVADEGEAHQLAQMEATTPFNLSTGPLLRVQLFQIADDDFLLVLNMHHIISDGWSMGVLMQELAHAYRAYSTNQQTTLPDLPIQYTDFALWQRDYLSGKKLEPQLAYWQEQLIDSPALLELPTDRPRPPAQSYRGAHYTFELSVDLTTNLNRLAQSHEATLFMVMLAAFNVLLARYSGQEDIVVGSPIANRDRSEVEGLIGFFVNTLVLRTQIENNLPFTELLAQVRQTTLDAYQHHDLPFEQLVDELDLARTLSYTPLFQVMLVLQNAEMAEFDLPDLTVTMQSAEFPFAKFDLTLFLVELNKSIRATLEYNTDLFDEATIARMASHFTVLLESIVSQPELPIHRLPMLSDAEYQQIAHEWNNTFVDFGEPQTIHALFEQQVERTPDAVALVFGNEQLTYAELNARANQLAHYLYQAGVQPETPVGICLNRSMDLIIATLAIIKAGGAYVPLDVTYPLSRLAFMIQDTEMKCVLTESALAASLPVDVQTIDINTLVVEKYPERNIDAHTTPENLLYIMYTSGSTGQPKGIEILHRNVQRLVKGANFAQLDATQTFLQLASPSFDAATLEIWGSLCNGAKLVLYPDSLIDPQRIGSLIQNHQITTLWLTAGLFHQMVDHNPNGLKGIKQLLAGGDVLSASHIQRLLASNHRELTIINGYGPTENTTFTTTYPISDHKLPISSVPIGTPINNTQVYLLSDYLQLVPVGVPGELYAGGLGVARGYRNRPDLTAERFIDHPEFGRLYKTGDLCRWLPAPDGDGFSGASIEFLGRTDFQVKIRGFRIELGEIEHALLAQEGVREAVVLAREENDDKRLVAYVVQSGKVAKWQGEEADPATLQPCNPATLRQSLAQQLPDYMIPSAFVFLDAMPLTPNGKLDRGALPRLSSGHEHVDTQTEFLAARNEIETVVAAIWQEVLQVERVGVYDNFFALGGHSLLATQVISRVRSQLNLDIPLKSLFEASQLGDFAEIVGQAQESMDNLIVRVSRDQPLPLSFGQQRLWFLDQLEPGSASYNMPAMIRLTGQLDVAALEASFRYLIERHESLRTIFGTKEDEGEPIQIIHPPSWAAQFILTTISVASEEEAAQLAQQEAMTPFSLSSGPLLRVRLFQITDGVTVAGSCPKSTCSPISTEQRFLLVLNMHHIISDGWSIGILMQELSEAYGAYATQQQPILPDLPIQYADFAVWQQQWITTTYLKPQLAYWKAQLGGELPTLDLPLDFPRPRQQTFTGGIYRLTLSQELSESLHALCRTDEVTLFMTLLAAFNLLLARLSGQDDILIGTPMAGRNATEVEGLIGLFLNTLVLRTDLSGNPSFTTLLEQIKQTTLDAHRNQDVPFEKLVEELHPERDLSRSPIFQVLFNMMPTEQPIEWPDVQIDYYELPDAQSKFDLTLYVQDDEKGIEIIAVYNRQLFMPERIEMMVGQYQHLLTQISQDATEPLHTYSLVTPIMQTMLPDLRQPIPEPSYDLVPIMIADWVTQAPQQRAIVQGDETWTYQEMMAFAQWAAQMLHEQSLCKGEVVAIWSENRPQLIPSILGVLLNGNVFLLLDPKLPRQRWQTMLEASQANTCIFIGKNTDEDTLVWLHEQCHTVLRVETSTKTPPIVGHESEHIYASTSLRPDDSAYIFFTSGTTGTPKGIRGTHKALAHFLHWQRKTFAVQPSDRVAQLTSLSFDVVLRTIFLPLVSGATLVLPETSDLILSADEVPSWLDAKKITIIHTVPSLAKAWLANHNQRATLKTLKWLFFAGEPLTRQLVKQWRETFPSNSEIVNLYGPTETTLAKCFYQVPQDMSPGIQSIGRPQPETHVVVMNQGRICGVGEVGEIVIRTPFRTQGYINGEHTFSPNPFTDIPDDLVYYTGDSGRIRPDGLIDILGRLDRQVKIRGVRIELSEIESALLELGQVNEVVVVVHRNGEDDKRLVAYIVQGDEANGKQHSTISAPRHLIDPSQLRQALAQQLPDYMLPSAFVFMEAIPLTPNGKLDRRALPQVPSGRECMDAQSEFVAPRNEVERAVAAIWQEVLGFDQASPEPVPTLRVPSSTARRIGIYDNFFTLGGHSLLATQVISRVRGQLNLEIPLKSLFEAPGLEDFAQILSQAQERTEQRIIPRLEAASPWVRRDQPLPLSFAQQRLWFLDQLEPDNAFYNIPIVLRLTGQLNVAALEASFRYLIERHESLRTVFRTAENDGEAIQIIRPPAWAAKFALTVRPVTDNQEAQRLAQLEATTPFTLSEGPLLRVQLLQIMGGDASFLRAQWAPAQDVAGPEQHYLLVLNMHHIISDGWSIGVLVRELTHAYRAYTTGHQPTLPDLPIQYADFALWQRDHLSGERLEAQLDYWRTQLTGTPALLELPTTPGGHPSRPPIMSYRGAHHTFELDADLTTKLNQLAQSHEATLFMVLMAAFNVLLARYTREEDIVVGSPIANRNHAEIESLIGFFVNTLVLRTRLEDNLSFTELLAQVRQTTLNAYEHQDLPFEQLVDALNLERTLSYSPLFQVMLVLQNAERGKFELPGLTATIQSADFPFTKFDLTLNLMERGNEDGAGLSGVFTYATDLFDQNTIIRMANHFTVLLEGIVDGSPLGAEQYVYQLPMLTSAEYHQVVHEWNNTEADIGKSLPIHTLVEQQVAHTPDAVALIFENQRMTYRELNDKANTLAMYLLDQDTGNGSTVPLIMDRCFEVVIAMLAVMKSGAAFVPLSIEWPTDRLQHILTKLQSQFVLTTTIDAHRLAGLDITFILVDEPRDLSKPALNPNQEVDLGMPIYVIYTSGSTGVPKGAINLHKGISNRFLWMTETFGRESAASVLQTTSHIYDSAVWQFFWPLTQGGKSILPSKESILDANRLSNLIGQHQVTLTDFVPSVFNIIVSQLEKDSSAREQWQSLRTLIVGAEEIKAGPVHIFRHHFPSVRLFNLYGPTEASIGCIAYEIKTLDERKIPIGKPIANVNALILDSQMNPVPIGVPGELYLGGICLGLGYIHDEQQTQAVFVDNPFPEIPSHKLYKTGDLATYLSDGNIEFLGRTDRQVKIRGFRIELGEIESMLRTRNDVHEVAVIVREDSSGDKRLIAYIVSHTPCDAESLRQYLAKHVPNYMIPSSFVMLDKMPLAPSGKLNQNALPEPTYTEQLTKHVPPETLDETRLVLVWQEVLDVRPIGVEDNFFELGGHSLLATRLVQRMGQTLQRDISLQQVFKSPTIRSLLQGLNRPQTTTNSFIPLRTNRNPDASNPLFLIHAVSGVAFPFLTLLPYLASDQAVYALQARGIYDDLPPFDSLEALATAAIQEMKSTQPDGPYAIAGWSFGGMVAFEMACQLTQQGEAVSFLGVIDAYPRTDNQASVLEGPTTPEELQAFCYLLGDILSVDYHCLDNDLFDRAARQNAPVDWLLEQMSEQGISPAMDPTIVKRIWTTTKHNSQLMQSYQPQPYDGTIILFCAEESAPEDGPQRWQALTPQFVETIWASGEHTTMLNAEHVERLGQALAARLEGVSQQSVSCNGAR
ncbi:MAG: amino acid adenylation domain-containing protein [Chloroflexota bacterium]